MDRKAGLYWIKYFGVWQPGYWNAETELTSGYWKIIGSEEWIPDRDILGVKISMIEPPE